MGDIPARRTRETASALPTVVQPLPHRDGRACHEQFEMEEIGRPLVVTRHPWEAEVASTRAASDEAPQCRAASGHHKVDEPSQRRAGIWVCRLGLFDEPELLEIAVRARGPGGCPERGHSCVDRVGGDHIIMKVQAKEFRSGAIQGRVRVSGPTEPIGLHDHLQAGVVFRVGLAQGERAIVSAIHRHDDP